MTLIEGGLNVACVIPAVGAVGKIGKGLAGREVAGLVGKGALTTGIEETAVKGSGAYVLEFESGRAYVGKGLESRMVQSGQRIETRYGDKLLSSKPYAAATEREAFIQGYQFMKSFGKPLHWDEDSILYNKIWTPGKKLLGE